MAKESSFQPASELEAGLTEILEILRCRFGQDFRYYKPNTFVRRIHRRMNLSRITTLEDYARHLRDNPNEVDLLQKDLLIGVGRSVNEERKRTIAPLEGSHNQRKACNEEMQTPKEELQPLDQELSTINLHLQEKIDELESVNSDLKQASREAHEQLALLARFPEENPNPVVRASADGKVLYANPASARTSVWGCATGNSLPEPLQPLFMEAIARGKEVQDEVRWDGRVFGVSISPFPAESYANIYGRDITQRTRVEAALRESEAHVRLKLHSILSPEGDIGSLDLADIIDTTAIQSLMTDLYELVRIPMAVIDLKGRVIVGVGWQEICTKFHRVHPETGRSCLESDTHLASGVSVGKFKLYKCKNHMWDIATPIIVASKHVGNIFCGQFFFDDERVDYDLFRSQAKRFGFDEADYLAALEKVPRLNREGVAKGINFFIKFADLISQMSYANINLARSVSEQDELVASLAASNRTLETQSEQLAAANQELESFSYSVSHDLQSPLRAIDGYSRMILRRHADCFDEDALAKFNVIRDNAQMMGRLINDLLAFSRLGKAHLSIAHLAMDVMVRDVWEEILAGNPERRLTLVIGAMPPAAGDRGLIRQVLVNLLSNAAKFTRQRPEALIEVFGHVKDSQCVYTVRDNGVGFDMQYHDKMFGVFQRLHGSDEFEGTGVGLAIVQRILQRHGGRVWAEGKVGHGACLYFTLPCAKASG